MPNAIERFFMGAALSAALGLAGCSDKTEKAATPDPAAQTEILKSNGYVTVANVGGGVFGDVLQRHLDTTTKKLQGGRPIDDYVVVPVVQVSRIRSTLDEAIAREGAILELDPAARDYAAALAAFDPVNGGLANYADSKGYLADGGRRARDEDDGFVKALRKVADAEGAFLNRIEERDERMTKVAFDAAPEGSLERYRAGIVLHGKAAMKDVTAVFTTPEDGTARSRFGKSLNEMASMVEDWDKTLRKTKPEGCPALQGGFNSVIANGRQALQSAEQGRFAPEAGSGAPSLVVQMEFNTLQSNFAAMISGLNNPSMC